MRKTRKFWAALIAVALTLTTAGIVSAAEPARAGLAAVGPTSSEHGFPVWYRDSNGLALELCLEGGNPLCGFPRATSRTPAAPPRSRTTSR
jgi:hypothetical protein